MASVSLPEKMRFVSLEVAQDSVTPRDQLTQQAKHLLPRSLTTCPCSSLPSPESPRSCRVGAGGSSWVSRLIFPRRAPFCRKRPSACGKPSGYVSFQTWPLKASRWDLQLPALPPPNQFSTLCGQRVRKSAWRIPAAQSQQGPEVLWPRSPHFSDQQKENLQMGHLFVLLLFLQQDSLISRGRKKQC